MIGDAHAFNHFFFGLRLFLGIITAMLSIVLTHLVIISPVGETAKKYLILLVTLCLIFWVAEVTFMFVSRSFSSSYPLADQNWTRKYWQPINSLGYRAAEIDKKACQDKINILVVGSSYTAGDGIDNIEDRFSNKLDAMLPDNYVVHNLGDCGSEAIDAFSRLNEYPISPDIIVFSHTTKTIKGIVNNKGSGEENKFNLLAQLGNTSNFLVANSYLLNYVFWKVYAPFVLQDIYLEDVANNPIFLYLQRAKFDEHMTNLQKFVDKSNNNDIPLIVVVFPAMNSSIGFTKTIVTDPIKRFFEERKVPVVDVYDLVKDIDPSDRVVNSNDAHPNKLVHDIVAARLFETITSIELVN